MNKFYILYTLAMAALQLLPLVMSVDETTQSMTTPTMPPLGPGSPGGSPGPRVPVRPSLPSRPGPGTPGRPSRPSPPGSFPGPGGRPTRRPSTTLPPFSKAPPSEYRLVNPENSRGMGRVEAFYNGTWAKVCSTYRWDDKDANVLCRQLGFDSGVRASPRHFPPSPNPMVTDETWVDEPGTPGRRPMPGGPQVEIAEKLQLVYNCGGNESKLYECPGEWVSYCYNDVAAICFDDETKAKGIDGVRLVTPKDQPGDSFMAMGKVEVLHRGYWGTICDSRRNIGQMEIQSICMKLGYKNGMSVYRNSISIPTRDDPVYWLNEMSCSSVTKDLMSCLKYEPGQKQCSSHYYDLTVMCYNNSAAFGTLPVQSLRLTNTSQGLNWMMGKVEILLEGQWGTVCQNRRYGNTDWNNDNAAVVCKQQGYRYGMIVMSSAFRGTDTPILWFNRRCPNDASSLNECKNTNMAQYDCTHGGAGVFCYNTEDDCSKMMIGSTRAPGPRGPPAPPAPISTAMPLSTPTKLEPIPEICRTRLRLTGSSLDPAMSSKAGRVEFYWKGIWGPICANGFDDREAHIVCKTLGFKTGRAMMNSSFGEGTGPTWLSNLQCAGNEQNLLDCSYRRQQEILRYPACSPQHQAGVVCDDVNEDEEVSVRLVNKDKKKGEEVFYGVVEINYKGHWGTICSNEWDDNDAKVVCRQMGYATGFALNNTQGIGTMPVWLEGVKCSGNENSIADCGHSGWAEKSMYALCDHSDDAGAMCISKKGKEKGGKKGKESGSSNSVSAEIRATTDDSGSSRFTMSTLTVILMILSALLITEERIHSG